MGASRPGRVRHSATFRALRFTRLRSRSGPVRIALVDDGDFDRPCVAFAISRKVGGAVVRNRLRRRLRAIAEEVSPQLKPGAYLVTVSTEVTDLSYRELRENVNAAFAAVMRVGRQ